MNGCERRRARGRGSRKKGFTLIELMMVILVLSILLTAAIPGISNAKRRANEASAIAALRLISQAQSQYRVRYGSFTSVPQLESSGLISDDFQDSEKSGYSFENAAAPTGGDWSVRANPTSPGVSGDRYFFVDTSGVIRYNDSTQASAIDAAIE